MQSVCAPVYFVALETRSKKKTNDSIQLSFLFLDPEAGVSKVAAHFRIMNRYFTPELGNTSSETYNQLVAELKLSVNGI